MPEPAEGRRVLVTGGAAVGKSTVCRLVAEALARSTVIEADIVRESIVGGFVEPDATFSAPFVEQLRLQRRIVNHWIEEMVEAGYDVIVDDAPIPPPPRFHSHYAGVLGHPTSVRVLLIASKETIRSRLTARSGPFDGWFLENLDELSELMEGWLKDPAWSDWTIIDTTDRTPREVARLIVSRL